jgi:hypothetical protein
LFFAAPAVGEGVKDGGLPDKNMYAVWAEPVVTVEVVVVKAVEMKAAPGADRAGAKMPLQARTVLSFIFNIDVDLIS